MDINSAFPSKWLRASDLRGQTVTVTIARVEMENISPDGHEEKPVIYFVGKEKGLVLNKTNAATIGAIHGPETDGWTGKPITLFEQMVQFQSQMVPAIRVMRTRGPSAAGAPAEATVPPDREPGEDDIDTDIPF